MSQYRILIRNMSTKTMSFYAFQRQAALTVAGAALSTFSSSLASGPLATHASSGAQLEFSFDAQIYVGARATVMPIPGLIMVATLSLNSLQAATSEASAVQPITLAGPGQTSGNSSALTIAPLGLAAPAFDSTLPAGNFAVQVPAFTPNSIPELYCGCASINQDGTIVLASYVTPPPNAQVLCAPIAAYYVKAGNYPTGQVISYDTSQAANCDFTSGFTASVVEYNNDGTFSVTNS
jgi:hypothetical protein